MTIKLNVKNIAIIFFTLLVVTLLFGPYLNERIEKNRAKVEQERALNPPNKIQKEPTRQEKMDSASLIVLSVTPEKRGSKTYIVYVGTSWYRLNEATQTSILYPFWEQASEERKFPVVFEIRDGRTSKKLGVYIGGLFAPAP
jgi:hypothetical protein